MNKYKKKIKKSAGGYMKFAQAADKYNRFITDQGNNALSNKFNLDSTEQDIVFGGVDATNGIPVVDLIADNASNMINAISGKTKSKLADYRTNQQSVNAANSPTYNIEFELGGSLNDINGPTHEQGGVQQTSNIETEGGETQFNNDYIFSDRLTYPGKKTSFAKLSKKIRDKYTGKRPNDKISKEAEERELATLADIQETVRGQIMSDAIQMAYGGSMKTKKKMGGGGTFDFDFTDLDGTDNNSLNNFTVDDIGLLAGDTPKNNNPLSFTQSDAKKYGINSKDNNIIVTPNSKSNTLDNDLGNMDWMDYGSMGLQVANAAFDLYQNRKIDPVNYKKAKPKLIDTYKAKRLASNEIDKQVNAGLNTITQTGDTGQRTLSNAKALAIKGAQAKGNQVANIMMQEELGNVDILNNFEIANTNIANKEIEDYAKNKGQVLTNRSTAMNNLTQNLVGSAGTAKKYKMQKYITSQLGTANWKWTKDGLITLTDTGEIVDPKTI